MTKRSKLQLLIISDLNIQDIIDQVVDRLIRKNFNLLTMIIILQRYVFYFEHAELG